EVAFKGLIDLIHRDRDYVEQHTQVLVKALDWERHHKQNSYLLIGEERQQAESWLKKRFKDKQSPCNPTDLHCEFIVESIKNANNLMTQVFISYAEQDQELMKEISRILMRESFTIWTNKTDIKTGTEFQEAINNGIEGADNLVWLISPSSIQSWYCQQEISHAFANNKRIIPLLIESINIGSIPPHLRPLHFLDFTTYSEDLKNEECIDKLLNLLQEEHHYYEQHKTLLVKALKWLRQNRNPSILLRGYNLKQAEAWLMVAKQRTEHPPLPLHKEFITESTKQAPESSLDVFIAYSRTDSDFARKLNDALQLQGKTTWFDQESIASGADFQREIYRGIESANNVLFIISPSSVNSPYCVDEVEYARTLNKRIVTVLYRAVPTTELHSGLASIQWIDFNNHNGEFYANFGELVRTLDTDLEYMRSHTQLLVKALEWDREEHDSSFLLRGKALKHAERWLKDSQNKVPQPTDLQITYIKTSRQFPFRKPKLHTVLLSSITATALLMGVRYLGVLQPLELAAYDQMMRLRPSEEQDKRFLIVEVTEKDIQALNQQYGSNQGLLPDIALASLLKTLNQYQPRVIGLDLYRDFKTNRSDLDNDLRQNQIVGICKQSYDLTDTSIEPGIKPPPEIPLDQVLERVGFSDVVSDADYAIRRHLLVNLPDPEFCPTQNAFSLTIARKYLETEGKPYKSAFTPEGQYVQPLQFGTTSLKRLSRFAGGYQGVDAGGYQTLLNYRTYNGDPSKFAPRLELSKVLANQILEEDVKDRIVLVGLTAASTGDLHSTPYGLGSDQQVPGVIIQAQMVSQILSAVLDGRPLLGWWPMWGDVAWVSVWALVGGGIVWCFQQPRRLIFAGVIALISLSGLCYFIFLIWGNWIPLVPAALVLVVTTGSVVYVTNKF
ncbi:MAG: CHASE2 domain-containing protein, partial [Coleofasciculus sp. S288]|nr:CHASE2 domain-containing protein [Coleofasciculus sp. S288]